MQGEYLLICGVTSSPRFLHVGHENQVFPDGSRSKRHRIVWLPKGPDCTIAQGQKSEAEVKNPLASSDSMTLSSSNDTMSVTDVAGPATEHQPAFTMLSSIPPKRRASVAQTHALHTPRTHSRDLGRAD